MKGSVCLLEFERIDTKWKLHGLWVTLRTLFIAEFCQSLNKNKREKLKSIATASKLCQHL